MNEFIGKNKAALALTIILIGFISRLIPHLWNFTPVLALALFAGVNFSRTKSLLIVAVLMFATDIIIGFYQGFIFTWLGLIPLVLAGQWLQRNLQIKTIVGASLVAALFFFVVSNFGVWLYQYPKTFEGLVQCYTLAIPFFRNTLASTVVYAVALIGGFNFIAVRSVKKAII